MAWDVSQLKKSGSEKLNHRDDKAASVASRIVYLPESPDPIKQQKAESGFQSSVDMPRKCATFNCLTCIRGLSPYSSQSGYWLSFSD